mgnify:CR=1 FL=1
MKTGAIVYKDYLQMLEKKIISSKNFNSKQIQPSSIDLTLSEECYEIKASFLSPICKVRKKLNDIIIKKINLNKPYIFKKNKTYLVKLNEKLNLPKNFFGKCNPKSSTGRLDIFCRTILDFSDEYEKIPFNYSGEIYLEITSRSFNIRFSCGDSLNQMRLICKKHIYLEDINLKRNHSIKPIIFNKFGKVMKPDINKGLKISVDLDTKNKICAFVAKKNAPILNFKDVNKHNIKPYWDSIRSINNSLIIEPKKFYILKSKEKIRIPNNMAGEMIPYDTGIGDFRVHYAGFFDPGFGDKFGSFAVLEVKTNEVPFILEDGQIVARINYEKLNKESKVVYGSIIKSNYQNQGLKLSKHFK